VNGRKMRPKSRGWFTNSVVSRNKSLVIRVIVLIGPFRCFLRDELMKEMS
jgi:hypothetical protein